MATINKIKTKLTHEGGASSHISPLLELKRSILANLLWEDTFYESGENVANRIQGLISKCDPKDVFDLAIKARNEMNLRHIPLLLAREMARLKTHKELVSELIPKILNRPDELTEFLAIYWKDGRCPISGQIKKGLASAFQKFDEYALAKYNRDGAVKLKDILFLTHAKPQNKAQESLWKRLINNELQAPDTWEVALSTGQNKKETFIRLIQEKKLGALAFIRNLRNMIHAKIDIQFIKDELIKIKTDKILPFRFISAANQVPCLEKELEFLMLKSLESKPKLKGKTVLLIDVSGSMLGTTVSKKSDIDRLDAACALAILANEVCEDKSIFTFSDFTKEIPIRRGMALKDAIKHSQPNQSTYLARAIEIINKNVEYDRIIIFTDEQSQDGSVPPISSDKKGYIINVGTYQSGVGYGQYVHISGFSEKIIDYIFEYENLLE